MKSIAEYAAVNDWSAFMFILRSAPVSPSFQLVKVRMSLLLAVRVTSVPSSYIFLPSTTVGAGDALTM